MKDKQQNQSALPPDSGVKTPKTNWGNLFQFYGDKPFMVRESDPFTNLFEDDPERPDYNRRDLDIDRE